MSDQPHDQPHETTARAVMYRVASLDDVDQLAGIRAVEWGPVTYWQARIRGYMTGLGPQKALAERTVVVATQADIIVGFAAAHLTRRLGCNGELQWINVERRSRGLGIAARLLELVAAWFVEHQSTRVCVDPDDASRDFYVRHGAEPLNNHWLVWADIGTLARKAPERQKPAGP